MKRLKEKVSGWVAGPCEHTVAQDLHIEKMHNVLDEYDLGRIEYDECVKRMKELVDNA